MRQRGGRAEQRQGEQRQGGDRVKMRFIVSPENKFNGLAARGAEPLNRAVFPGRQAVMQRALLAGGVAPVQRQFPGTLIAAQIHLIGLADHAHAVACRVKDVGAHRDRCVIGRCAVISSAWPRTVLKCRRTVAPA